ncbi:MAG: GIY-YIG nuclease family protein [Candidatus Hydrogenedentes bacterium]|nr:GIY-YIG nuclease family protein [Candidatus Hydrogenedentota bacterium]
MPFWVYVLRSQKSGKTYVGQTNDLARRILEHNDPSFNLTLYTKRNPGPWELVHSEEYPTRTEAMRREKYLKSGQGREWVHALLHDM